MYVICTRDIRRGCLVSRDLNKGPDPQMDRLMGFGACTSNASRRPLLYTKSTHLYFSERSYSINYFIFLPILILVDQYIQFKYFTSSRLAIGKKYTFLQWFVVELYRSLPSVILPPDTILIPSMLSNLAIY